jgi:hypothetical protein
MSSDNAKNEITKVLNEATQNNSRLATDFDQYLERVLFMDRIKDKAHELEAINKALAERYLADQERYDELDIKRKLIDNPTQKQLGAWGEENYKKMSEEVFPQKDRDALSALEMRLYQQEPNKKTGELVAGKIKSAEDYIRDSYFTTGVFKKIADQFKDEHKVFKNDVNALTEAKVASGKFPNAVEAKRDTLVDMSTEKGLFTKKNALKVLLTGMKAAAIYSNPALALAMHVTGKIMEQPAMQPLKNALLSPIRKVTNSGWFQKMKKVVSENRVLSGVAVGGMVAAYAMTAGGVDPALVMDTLGDKASKGLDVVKEVATNVMEDSVEESVEKAADATLSVMSSVTVQTGDTLTGLLEKFDGTSFDLKGAKLEAMAQAIAQDNWIEANHITDGQKIAMPTSPEALQKYAEQNADRLAAIEQTLKDTATAKAEMAADMTMVGDSITNSVLAQYSEAMARDVMMNMDPDQLEAFLDKTKISPEDMQGFIQTQFEKKLGDGEAFTNVSFEQDLRGRRMDGEIGVPSGLFTDAATKMKQDLVQEKMAEMAKAKAEMAANNTQAVANSGSTPSRGRKI